ncbi:hypothetical protein BV20DRAFT_1033801 [Pilatotrama ljubarskyi]|nr:hypothetical protein BV20DRAFT_1033801 [Pilatotrama ljubarskyi]
MSTMFTPGFMVDGSFPDIALISSDSTVFHAHTRRLLSASTNAFAGYLAQPVGSIALPESAAVLNVVLHLIYGMFCLHFQPSFESTEAALDALNKYGVPVSQLASSQPLYQLILSYAPYYPIEAYALAAHYQLEDAAVAVSGHLLAYDMSKLTDELTVKMGPLYLARLIGLHQSRARALRDIALRPPASHPPTSTCSDEEQAKLQRGWAFANADIVWQVLPSKSRHPFHSRPLPSPSSSVYSKAGASVTCPDCHQMLRNRIQEVTTDWLGVKTTI